MTQDILGIDIGGVLMDKANDDTDTSFFSDNYLRTTATAGMFEAVALLVERRFAGNMHIVSKAGTRVRLRSLNWFEHHDFYARTGVHRDNVHFCKKRHQKHGICESLGITHFIDDHVDVLRHLTSVPAKFLYDPTTEEFEQSLQFAGQITVVSNWNGALAALL